MNNRLLLILSLICFALCASAQERTREKQTIDKDSIFQGMSIKLDIAMPILELARSKGAIQDYEIAINARLANRFYPTLEMGYALASTSADGGDYSGQGGFARIGMDLSALQKGNGENCLMAGLRFGGAYQQFDLTNITLHNDYWQLGTTSFLNQHKFDCWGEIVAGCQVQIWKGFQMGWYARMKLLFTRTDKQGDALPAYLPGFGYRRDFNWGLNYFLGYRF